MEKDLVSIITPSYNSGKFIAETIESVIAQSYQNWEMIIVDDGSVDNTESIVNSFIEKDDRIQFYKNEVNSGPAITRNNGIDIANGRFISFLDSDDLWTNDKLTKQIDFMLLNNYPFTFSYYAQIDENGFYIQDIDNLPSKVTYHSSLRSNKIGCLTAVYDTVFFGKQYMEDLPNRQDYTLWLKLLKRVNYAHCCTEILAKYRVRSNSISSKKFKLIKYHWIIYRNFEKNNLLMSTYYLTNYIINKIFINK